MSSSPPFTLLEVIGSGGMATVYRARDNRLARDVAVKVLHTALLEKRDVRKRFLREATALARCAHPNIVQVYGCSEPGVHKPYLVTELVTGSSLDQWIQERGPFPWEVAVALVERSLRGLACIHDSGFLHRDLKPENILLTREGIPKIGDFGIARFLDATAITAQNEAVGTLRYMPPEMFEEGTASRQGDIYSMGCVLYELIAGRPTFDQESTPHLINKILGSTYPPLRDLRPEVWTGVGGISEKAMNRDPAGRYPDAVSMRSACQAIMDEVGAGDTESLLEAFVRAEDRASWLEGLRQKEVETLLARGHLARVESRTADFYQIVDSLLRMAPDHPGIDALTAAVGGPVSPEAVPAPDDPGPPTTTRTVDIPLAPSSTAEGTGSLADHATKSPPLTARPGVLKAVVLSGMTLILIRLALVGAVLVPVVVTTLFQGAARVLARGRGAGRSEDRGDPGAPGVELAWFLNGLASLWLVMLFLPDPFSMGTSALGLAILLWSLIAVPHARALPSRPLLPLGLLGGLAVSSLPFWGSATVTILLLLQLPILNVLVLIVMVIFVMSGFHGTRHLVRGSPLERGFWKRPAFWGPILILPLVTIASAALACRLQERVLEARTEQISHEASGRAASRPSPRAPRLVVMSGIRLGVNEVSVPDGVPGELDRVLDAVAAAKTWGIAVEVKAGAPRPGGQKSVAAPAPDPQVVKVGERLLDMPSERIVFVRPMEPPADLGEQEYSRWRRETLITWANRLHATHLELPARSSLLGLPSLETRSFETEWEPFLQAEATALRERLPGVALGVTVTVIGTHAAAHRAAADHLQRAASRSWIDWVAMRVHSPPLPPGLSTLTELLESQRLLDKFWLITSPGVIGWKRFSHQERQDRLWMEYVRRFVRVRGIPTWAHYPLESYSLDLGQAMTSFVEPGP